MPLAKMDSDEFFGVLELRKLHTQKANLQNFPIFKIRICTPFYN